MQLRDHVMITVMTFFTVFILACVACSGGAWSTATIGGTYMQNTTHLGKFSFKFGLTGYEIKIGDLSTTYVEYASEEARLEKIWGGDHTSIPASPTPKPNATSSPELFLDYQDARVGGRTCTAFLAFGIIITLMAIVLHIMLWPMNKNVLLVHRVVLMVTLGLVISYLIAFLAWNALGHSAAQRIAFDRFTAGTPATKKNAPLPDVERGWCYNLTVVCCVCSLLAVIPSYFAQKLSLERPEVFDALVDGGVYGDVSQPQAASNIIGGGNAGQKSYGGGENAYGYDEM